MELTKKQKLIETIVQKSWEDDAFKQELIANPVKVIESIIGEPLDLDEGKTIIVNDQTDASNVYINIPPQLDLDDVELTEEQLEIIAGGGDPPSAVIQITDPAPGL
ncbi:NHLP leader peptide family RiPP precursor [Kordia sp.]|uniref:NHLP leader peptide family RiPP precursor n=1 Tax=Kordia sp. TaxID=1965332 RepID=UPI003D6C0EE6